VSLETVPELEVEVPLSPAAVAALARWEARAGEIVTVVDPLNTAYRARLTELSEERGRAVPFQRFARYPESPVAIEVYQALPEKERFELVLQKLTELGVARIVPFVSRRSSTLEERDAGQRKSHRWPDVVLRAARQCRRAILPELYPVVTWDEATYLANHADLRLMLFEGEAPWTLREGLGGERPDRIALLVGPEGGFAPEEVEDARGMGFLPVSVGPRLLRTETAAIAAAAAVQYALGDLG
jgi:16S rRNA (uracil1498-N3)-methyltransferase